MLCSNINLGEHKYFVRVHLWSLSFLGSFFFYVPLHFSCVSWSNKMFREELSYNYMLIILLGFHFRLTAQYYLQHKNRQDITFPTKSMSSETLHTLVCYFHGTFVTLVLYLFHLSNVSRYLVFSDLAGMMYWWLSYFLTCALFYNDYSSKQRFQNLNLKIRAYSCRKLYTSKWRTTLLIQSFTNS